MIVGAGPGGLASAMTLGSYGVETLVVERRYSPSTLPRANTASTGTMELLRRWGLEEAARERSHRCRDAGAGPPDARRRRRWADGRSRGFRRARRRPSSARPRPRAWRRTSLNRCSRSASACSRALVLERGVELTALEPAKRRRPRAHACRSGRVPSPGARAVRDRRRRHAQQGPRGARDRKRGRGDARGAPRDPLPRAALGSRR